MNYLPNAFDPPVWYLVMPVCGATGEVFTQKRYADIIAARLNNDQRHALMRVEDYTFLPSAIHLMVREVALTLDLWWQPFMDGVLEEMNKPAGGTLSWCDYTSERIADADALNIVHMNSYSCRSGKAWLPILRGTLTTALITGRK